MRLSTQLHRSLFALPLLAIGLAAGSQGDAACLMADADAGRAGSPLLEASAGPGCAEALRPVGARALARVPGDIGELGLRVRCAS